MKFHKNVIATALALTLVGAMPIVARAATVDLSTSGWVTYGDANSYALNVNGLNVSAATGQLIGVAKLGINSQNGNSTPGMDDAFDTPTANTVEGFRMSSANEPGGAVSQGLGTEWPGGIQP